MTTTQTDPFLTLGFAAIDWIEHYLIHGPGDVQGQPIELDDEFAAFIVKAYQVDVHGDRKVRRAFLSRSKGRSKSGLAAMIECFEALGPCRFDHWSVEGELSPWGYEYEEGEPVGAPLVYVECLNVATEEGQAGNTYDAVYYMLNPETCSKELLRDYGRIDVGLTRTNLPGRRGFIEPVSSADKSKDGGKSTFIVADETHLWVLPRLKRLHGTMTRNLLKRKIASGWMLETSTMYGEGEDSVAEGTHAYALAVHSGRRRDRTLLFDHRQASDKWDLTKRADRMKALREAYGPAAEWMNLDAICDSYDDPQVSEAEFRRYWLNQPVPTDIAPVVPSAIELSAWTQIEDPGAAMTEPLALAVETSQDLAFSSIGAAGRTTDGRLVIDLVKRDRGMTWVAADVIALATRNGVRTVALDGKGQAREFIEPLQAAGLSVLILSSEDLTEACSDIVRLVEEHQVVRGPQPDLDAAVTASRRRGYGDGLFTFSRRTSVGDISPLYAVTIAAWAATREPQKSAYESRSLMTV